MHNANQIDLIPWWTYVNASCCAYSVCVSRTSLGILSTMWGVHIGGAHLEVCVGWYPSQDLSWGLPLAGGEGFIAVSC